MDAEEKISLRLSKQELDRIDKKAKKDKVSRSKAIRAMLDSQMDIEDRENTITVEVPGLLMKTITALVKKEKFRDKEHAIQAAIDHYFTHERIDALHKATKGMEIISGRKIEVDVDKVNSKVLKQ